MPSLAGIFSGNPSLEGANSANHMAETMTRGSFQGSGSVLLDSLGLALGWTVRQSGSSGDSPVWNRSRDVALVFSGQWFSGNPLPLENILGLYEQCGLDFLQRLNGWFSGVLFDLRLNRAFLFNDRYGLGRIYVHQAPDACYFASQAKALLKVLPVTRQLDLDALAQQFSCGCTLQNRTLFNGISLLPPGSVWTFSPGEAVKKETYFKPETWENQETLDADSFYSALRDTFPRLLAPYLEGSQKIGMSLTGGLDGRMIMAWAKAVPGSLPCYSFGGSYRDCEDVRLARKIAQLCGQSHQVIPIGAEFLRNFRTLAEDTVRVSDGTMDVTGAVELYANRIAREIAPVRLTGNYGSEILRGNVAFRPGSNDTALLSPDFAERLKTAAQTYGDEAAVHRTTFIAFKQVPWHHYSRLSVEQSQLTLRSPFLDNDLVKLVYRAPRESVSSPLPALQLIADGNPQLAKLPTDRGLLLRPRPWTPLKNFWHELTVRAEYAYDYGMPASLAKLDHRLRALHLERLFLGRHKFYHFRVWYRDQLANCVKEILLDQRSLSRPYLQGKQVEKMVKEHTSGRMNHTRSIHKLLTAELTQRQLLE